MSENINIFDVPMEGEFEGETIRDYLRNLLVTLWDEGECFSGKRPFGNSDWKYDIYIPLVRHGFFEGFVNECGDIDIKNIAQADQYIHDMILGGTFND